MKDRLYETVKKYITAHGMIVSGDSVAAGISGGADSVCMLHLLWRLQKERPFWLAAVHVDHGLRTEAGEDAAFVEKLCGELKLPFYLQEVDMPGYAAAHKVSVEEAGRILRYQAFHRVLHEMEAQMSGKIAVAHNAQDRAETMLFHMFRGSGLKGLSAMRPVRDAVIRPLLAVSREEIEAYLRAWGLIWREDTTNEEDTYTRNRIRHHILPYAQKEICPGAVAHMGELAALLAETEDYLERETGRLYDSCVQEMERKADDEVERTTAQGEEADGGQVESLQIQLADLMLADDVMKKRVLLRAMEKMTPCRKDITARHIMSLLALMKKNGSKEVSLPYGIKACKEYDLLFLKRVRHDREAEQDRRNPAVQGMESDVIAIPVAPKGFLTDSPVEVIIPGTGEFTFILRDVDSLEESSLFYKKEQNIPENRYTKWFDYDKITTSLLLRTRREGDYLTIDGAFHTQSLKRYMINEKIPKARRDDMFILADESHVLWVPGYRISSRYKVEKGTKRILEVRLRGGNDGGTSRGIVDGGAG